MALEGDAEKVHRALMLLVEAGDPRAVIYAHQQLIGKPTDEKAIEQEAKEALNLGHRTTPELLQMAESDEPH